MGRGTEVSWVVEVVEVAEGIGTLKRGVMLSESFRVRGRSGADRGSGAGAGAAGSGVGSSTGN